MRTSGRRSDRGALVLSLRDVFRARGWEGASLADLAVATGLSRASLYHHFPNGKADMAAAALADVEARLDQQIVVPLRGAGAPAAKLEGMARTLDGYYRQGDLGCFLGAFSQNQDAHGLGDRVARTFVMWIDALSAVAIESGLDEHRARDNALAVVVAIQGALVLARATASQVPFRSMLVRLPELLFAPAPRSVDST